eukprot:COSAG05_NODE_658_length_8055_cov_10.693188_3_plen_172_part_00
MAESGRNVDVATTWRSRQNALDGDEADQRQGGGQQRAASRLVHRAPAQLRHDRIGRELRRKRVPASPVKTHLLLENSHACNAARNRNVGKITFRRIFLRTHACTFARDKNVGKSQMFDNILRLLRSLSGWLVAGKRGACSVVGRRWVLIGLVGVRPHRDRDRARMSRLHLR